MSGACSTSVWLASAGLALKMFEAGLPLYSSVATGSAQSSATEAAPMAAQSQNARDSLKGGGFLASDATREPPRSGPACRMAEWIRFYRRGAEPEREGLVSGRRVPRKRCDEGAQGGPRKLACLL